MILLHIQGGLGNQLFQYAAARHLCKRLHTKLYIDISPLQNDLYGRSYRLNHFNVKVLPANNMNMQIWNRFNGTSLLSHITTKVATNLPKSMRYISVREQQFHFDDSFFHLRGNVSLQGYYQSLRYFEPIEILIRDELTLKEEPTLQSRQIAAEMQESNSISLHVRRADYITDPGASKVFAIQTVEYYQQAIMEMRAQIKEPHFFIFSDDMEWCRQNLFLEKNAIYVDHNGVDRDYEDIWLMGQCKHHIIANSSFSWWGAWLGNNPEKRVIAPKRWFIDSAHNDKDLIPSNWIRL